MSRTTSRWMSRSTSKTRLSTVAFTAPSIEFSMGTKASVGRPTADGLEGLGERGGGDEVGRRVVGLREQGLFGEGPCRAEEADRVPCSRTGDRSRIHVRQDSGHPWTSPPCASCSTTSVPECSVPTMPSPDCVGSPSSTSASRASTITVPCASAPARPSTRRGRRRNSVREIVAELLAEPGQTPVLLTRADDEQVAASLDIAPDGDGDDDRGRLSTVCWRLAPAADRSGRSRDGGHRGSPCRRRVPGGAASLRVLPHARGRLWRGGCPPPPGVGRRCRRRRRGRRGGRDGGRACQPGGRDHRRARSWPYRCRRAMERRSTASPRCSPCTRRVRRGSPSSGSTTGSALPAPSPGCCRERRARR